MDSYFREGFEKNANVIRRGAKALGRITGVSQLATGVNQVKRRLHSGAAEKLKGNQFLYRNKKIQNEFKPGGSISNRINSGIRRLAATTALGGAGVYGMTRGKKK